MILIRWELQRNVELVVFCKLDLLPFLNLCDAMEEECTIILMKLINFVCFE